ncbi:hypothetical protein GCM10027022_02260 [Alpinimonas psychrophila]|uniref:Uncharacterized small protein (DUF1192 family) n=1 Tax=Alpinimonas psychrophila TaxID=748908 RepID=A0A7W3JRT7_9MICO|nr:DUF4349 domain-containing protein [Alpinimonas psychrophila]MBA8828035.1 uncharacterized small protein (DUF1192 family) [Alpinimonas psychrophila]
MKRLLALGVLASALLLTGCSTGGSTAPSVSLLDSGMVTSEGLKANPNGSVATDSSGAVVTDSSRSVVKTSAVSVAVEHPFDIAPELAAIAARAGGYVQDSSSSPASDYQSESAFATLRVPADKLNSVTEEVLALGSFVSSSQSETDVTLQVTDVEARIASLTTSIDRLTALMANATNTADLLAAESALTQRQGELESLVGQRDYLANQVDLATLSVSVIQTTDAAPTSQSFWDGLSQGWQSVINVGSVLVVALGFLLPWLAIMAGIALVAGAVIWLSVRATRSRRGAGPPSESSDSSQN